MINVSFRDGTKSFKFQHYNLLNRLTSFANGKVGGSGHHQRCCCRSFWALSIAGFNISARVQSLAGGFPILAALHYFFQLNLKPAWHMRSRPAITIEWNFLHKLDLEMIYSNFNQISYLCLSGLIYVSLNAEHFICFCGEFPIAILWCFNEPFQKSPSVEGQWMSACCARWSFGIMSL